MALSQPTRTPLLIVVAANAWHEAKELAMNLAWWSEHPSELPLLLLTAVVTHLLMLFSQTLTNALYGLFRCFLARPS